MTNMKIINDADTFVKRSIGLQEIEPDLEYIESPYLIKYDKAIFNSLTREAVVVEDPTKELSYLISHWFYIPKGLDVSSLYHLIRQRLLKSEKGPGSFLKESYTIFTTTACNASCPYCFEKGFDILTMSDKTAEDVASYILSTRNTFKIINIEWFGGEPLCNKKVITTICNILKKNGVKFTSGLTTNGSLLPDCTDEELKDIWNVTHVQLTFDNVGIGYDKLKHLPEGTFDKLIKSMERLERMNIYTLVRIHYNPELGKEPCIKVIDSVSHFNNIRPYTRLLYGNSDIECYKVVLELNDYIDQNVKRRYAFPTVTKTNYCIADTDRRIAITPEGKLTPCGHYAYGEYIFGDIYSDEINKSILKKWKTREKVVTPSCKTCPLYPSCRKIVMCPAEGKCSEGYQYYQIETIKRALRKKVEEINGRDSNTNN